MKKGFRNHTGLEDGFDCEFDGVVGSHPHGERGGHYPIDEIGLNARVEDEITFDFDGIGFTISGHVESTDGSDHVLKAELYIDGELTETVNLPTAERARRFIPFFRYELQDGEHAVRIRLINSNAPASLYLDRAIVYASAPHSGIR